MAERDLKTSGNNKNIPVDKKRRPARSLDVGRALKLRLKHALSYGKIAKELGVSKTAVHKALKEYEDLIKDPESIQTYRDNRALILDAVEMRLVGDLVNDGKREKASLNNTAYAAQVVNNIGRLERGQSTQNVHSIITAAAKTAEKLDPS